MYIYKFIWDINYYIMCVYTNINIYNISKKHVYLPIHEWLVEAKTSSKDIIPNGCAKWWYIPWDPNP